MFQESHMGLFQEENLKLTFNLMDLSHIKHLFSKPSCGLNTPQDKLMWDKLKDSIEEYDLPRVLELIEYEESLQDHCIDLLQLDEDTDIYKYCSETLFPILIQRGETFRDKFRLADKDLLEFDLSDVTIYYQEHNMHFGPESLYWATLRFETYSQKQTVVCGGDGIEEFNLPDKSFVSILEKMIACDFLQLRDSYTAEPKLIIDDSSAKIDYDYPIGYRDSTITLQIGDKFKQIYLYYGYPKELEELSEEIHYLIDVGTKLYKIKPKRCPFCESRKVVRIIYGEPSTELWAKSEAGEVICGGCCISEFSPKWGCVDCGAEFRKEVKQ